MQEQFKVVHNWRQFGNFIHCDRCPNGHGRSIGTDHLLVGTTEQGTPILRKIDL